MTGPASTAQGTVGSAVRWVAVSQGGSKFLSFLTSAWLARLIGPDEFGGFAAALVLLGLLGEFGDAGFGAAITRDRALDPRTIRSILGVGLVVSSLLALVAVGTAALLAASGASPITTTSLRLAAVGLLVSPLASIGAAVLRRNLALGPVAAADLVSAAMGAAVSVAAAFLGERHAALALGFIARAFARAAMLVFAAAGHGVSLRPSLSLAPLRERPGLIRFAALQLVDRIVYYGGNNVDVVVIGTALGTTALGFYTLGYNLVVALVRFFGPFVTSVALPRSAWDAGDLPRLRQRYLDVSAAFLSVLAPALATVAIAAPVVVSVAYGAGWEPVVVVVRSLSLMGLLYGLRAVANSMLLAAGRAGLALLANVLAVAFPGVGAAIGARLGALPGAAIGVSIGFLLLFLCVEAPIRRRVFALSWDDMARALRGPAVALVVALVLATALAAAVATPMGSVGAAAAFAATYVLVLIVVDRPFLLRLLVFAAPRRAVTS